jgi:hypothetical protein
VAEPRDDTRGFAPEVAGDGDDGEDQERRHQREERRQLEHEPVGLVGKQVLLEEQLYAVRERLEDPPRAGLVGADAVLHAGYDLALEPHHEHHGDHQEHEGDDDLEQHDEYLGQADVTAEQGIAQRTARSTQRHAYVDDG